MKGLERLATGIMGLDEVLQGGIPRGRTVLISGETGTGKTVLLGEFIYCGISLYRQHGVFVTFEEKPRDIMTNVLGFGRDFSPFVRNNKMAFVDVSVPADLVTEIGTDFDVSPLVERIRYAVRKIRAQRVVIDNINAMFWRFSNKDSVRRVLCLIAEALKMLNVTSLISMETGVRDTLGIEEFVVDGAIQLETHRGQQRLIRNLFVKKMRGAAFRSGVVEYDITDQGIIVYPKIPADLPTRKTSFNIRRSTGVKKLDEIMGGGVPQGHAILVSGNTGTGKTILAMQFIVKGLEEAEAGVYVCLEEPVMQVKKTALGHGWDFGRYEKEGKLSFVTTNLIDISNDKLLYQIIKTIEKTGARRLVFDSISSLMSGAMDEEEVRQFLLQLAGYLKSKGVTSYLNYLSPANFGAAKGQLLGSLKTSVMRLSSVTDGILMLLFVERGQRIKKTLSVLKMRGSPHSKDIFQYDIQKGGIKIGEKFED